jgi:hypothetical protein
MRFTNALRALLVSPAFLFSVAVSWVGLSAFLSVTTSEWHWFQRSGAVVVGAGALLSTRRLIRLGTAGAYVGETTWDDGHVVPTEEELAADRQRKADISAMYLGFITVVTGTVIWAYGDLVGRLV